MAVSLLSEFIKTENLINLLFTELTKCRYYVTSESQYKNFIPYNHNEGGMSESHLMKLRFSTLAQKSIRIKLTGTKMPDIPTTAAPSTSTMSPPATTTWFPQRTSAVPTKSTSAVVTQPTVAPQPTSTMAPATTENYEIGEQKKLYNNVESR